MREIIKDKAIVNDDWTVLRLAEGEAPESVVVPAGKFIVPLTVWEAQRTALKNRADIGVWIASFWPGWSKVRMAMLKPGSTPGRNTISPGLMAQPYLRAMSPTICSRNSGRATL